MHVNTHKNVLCESHFSQQLQNHSNIQLLFSQLRMSPFDARNATVQCFKYLNINLHILFLVLKVLVMVMVLVSVGKARKGEIEKSQDYFLSFHSYWHIEFFKH